MRALIVLAGALGCSACMMQENVRFRASPEQQAIMRDGQPALISRKKSSVVMIRSAERRFASGSRPVFVIAMRNVTEKPIDFLVRDITVTQTAGADRTAMKVFSYDELVAEEEEHQMVTGLLVAAATATDLALASQAGYRTSTTTVNSPSGSHTYRSRTYNPSTSLAAYRRAIRRSQSMINAASRENRGSLAALEREVIKDNTLMPGEWYGGTLHVEAPPDTGGSAGPKRYVIAMTVGPDRHEIEVVQEAVE